MNQRSYSMLLLISIPIFFAGCSNEKTSEKPADGPIEISGLPPDDVGSVDDHGGTGSASVGVTRKPHPTQALAEPVAP
jgi:hypothetical protein